MITIFTIPKAFTDPHIRTIQYNAIKSWTLLQPNCEIILVGNDEGVAEAAKTFDIKHIPGVKYNEFNTPLLDSAFELVKKESKNKYLCYVNSDIILLNNFSKAMLKMPKENFLAVGRRIDLDIKKEINFKSENWKKEIKCNGKLHSYAGIDYFIFEHKSFNNIPPFAVGRVGWDNWMILNARKNKLKTIDTTEAITAIHQNHDYPAINKGIKRKTNPEAKKNNSFIKNPAYTFTIEDTNWKLDKTKLNKKWLYWWPFWKRYIKFKIRQ